MDPLAGPTPAASSTPPISLALPLEADLVREYRRIQLLDIAVGNPLSSTAFQVYAFLDILLGVTLFAVLCTLVFWIGAAFLAFGALALFPLFARASGASSPAEGLIASAELPIGPLSWLLIVRHRARLRAIADDLGEPTPEVIEQLARRIAEPLLHQARFTANYAPAPKSPERIDRRLDELRRELHAETDPTWRAAIQSRIAALDEDRREIERSAAAHAARARRIKDEADALEAALDRMSRRTRLLRELAEDRAETTIHADDPAAPALDPLADLRTRLAELSETLQSHESLARSRAAAEVEIQDDRP